MDLTYMPGELDVKNAKKGNDLDLKREHDSVDDFEHLDPDLSPGEGHAVKDKFETKSDIKDYDVPTDLIEKDHGDDLGLPSKTLDSLSGKVSPNTDLMSDFDIQPKQINTEVDLHFGNEGKSNLHFSMEPNIKLSDHTLDAHFSDDHSLNKSFISAEIAINNDKTEHDIPILDSKFEDNAKETGESHILDRNDEGNSDNEEDLIADPGKSNSKSMKEDDALPQYETKPDRRESPKKDDVEAHKPECPETKEVPPPAQIERDITPEPKIAPHEDISEFKHAKDSIGLHKEVKETPPVQEPQKPEVIATPVPPVSKANVKSTLKKTSISDLDDIIGPHDVFKRIGLVEALVYWRDPKKSGVVFGGGMAILLSLCFMSLISVVAYTSLFALSGAICFRIYKNILQAVQKTSEGHPFKEFLELELSLPQDKVREAVDTAVVHVNAGVVELRRLFLVEDLIDSIKFGVCLWCLTYVGAIFNGMTLVILAFVALFTVPKIYENNKASIDQYIDMGRSKVAEITSKVKAALPIGKKEPEKDKEQ